MKSKTDGDLSLDSYWKKHCISIAKDRHWAIQEGDQYSFETCTTLRQYDDYIKKVAGYLDMSISEITPANILLAVSKVAKECKYQEATVKTIISALRDIFCFANLRRWNTIINDSVNEIIAKVACTRPIVPIKL